MTTYVTLTKYGWWLAARRRLLEQIAGRAGWVVQEAGDE